MFHSRIIDAPDDPAAIFDLFDEQGLIDGHPIIPPTEARVQSFLAYVEDKMGRKGGEVLGLMPMAMGEVTIEKVAINAVMAGCRPDYMPVLIAAVELLVQHGSEMGLEFASHTKHLWMMVNGPIRSKLNIQLGEHGSIGASWRANATMMRAVRFVVLNCGGRAGVTGKKSYGFIGSYLYCLAENEESSPWDSYAVERGFKPEDSTVLMLNVEPPKHVELGRWAYTPAQLLAAFCDSMSNVANRYAYGESNVFLILAKDHANTLAAAGFSKADVKRFLFEHARTPYGKFGPNAGEGFLPEWQKFYTHSPDAMVPMARGPEFFHVFVCGGPGPNSLFTGQHRGEVPIKKIDLPSD
jgi:hypothetical protein